MRNLKYTQYLTIWHKFSNCTPSWRHLKSVHAPSSFRVLLVVFYINLTFSSLFSISLKTKFALNPSIPELAGVAWILWFLKELGERLNFNSWSHIYIYSTFIQKSVISKTLKTEMLWLLFKGNCYKVHKTSCTSLFFFFQRYECSLDARYYPWKYGKNKEPTFMKLIC